MSDPLHIETFSLSDWMTNCFVIHSDAGGSRTCWIVDAGFEPQPLVEYVQRHDLMPSHVILTHAHVDHIAGLSELRQQWPQVAILSHEAEHAFLTDPRRNLSAMMDRPIRVPAATGKLEHGQSLELDGASFEVRHTPGHSPGGITLYQADLGVAIVGDALFASSIGRTDFPGSDHATLIRSIRQQIFSLPDETRVLSGHGPETAVGRERASNPFLRV